MEMFYFLIYLLHIIIFDNGVRPGGPVLNNAE